MSAGARDGVVPATDERSPAEAAAVGDAEALFGPRMDLARRFADHLTGSGVERGLIGPREAPRLWARHLMNCARVAALVPQGASLVDVGSGAGLPGLVLAIARPDVSVTLVEPLLRRTTWLTEVVADLRIDVRVVRCRAQEHAVEHAGEADVATARALAPLDRLVDLCLPLVAPGGQLLALKGSAAAQELLSATSVLERWGASGEVLETGSGEEASFVVRVRVPDEGTVAEVAGHDAPADPTGSRSHRLLLPPTPL